MIWPLMMERGYSTLTELIALLTNKAELSRLTPENAAAKLRLVGDFVDTGRYSTGEDFRTTAPKGIVKQSRLRFAADNSDRSTFKTLSITITPDRRHLDAARTAITKRLGRAMVFPNRRRPEIWSWKMGGNWGGILRKTGEVEVGVYDEGDGD